MAVFNFVCTAVVFAVGVSANETDQTLWRATPFTQTGDFTEGIEGPACDRDGNIFAVNFQKQGTIGRVSPSGKGGVFIELPQGSVGNGIRFDKAGHFYVADYVKHQIIKVDPTTKTTSVFAQNQLMNQPNDIAITDDGTLFASDPNWGQSTGQIWRIDQDGSTTLVAKDMGTANGIDVTPDNKILYVYASLQLNVWAFTIADDKTLVNKRLVRKFDDHGFDGMRADIDGNLYITRYGKGTVVKMSPSGEILQEVDVLGMRPSNLCFGGPDGKTVYVTEVESTRLVSFRVDRPGLEWKRHVGSLR
jgi:sugar lactone lactonase YvrE